jgi:hypothetical protein
MCFLLALVQTSFLAGRNQPTELLSFGSSATRLSPSGVRTTLIAHNACCTSNPFLRALQNDQIFCDCRCVAVQVHDVWAANSALREPKTCRCSHGVFQKEMGHWRSVASELIAPPVCANFITEFASADASESSL